MNNPFDSIEIVLFNVPDDIIELARNDATTAEAEINKYQEKIKNSCALREFIRSARGIHESKISQLESSVIPPSTTSSAMFTADSPGLDGSHRNGVCRDEQTQSQGHPYTSNLLNGITKPQSQDPSLFGESLSSSGLPKNVAEQSNSQSRLESKKYSDSVDDDPMQSLNHESQVEYDYFHVPSDSSDEEIERLDFLCLDPDDEESMQSLSNQRGNHNHHSNKRSVTGAHSSNHPPASGEKESVIESLINEPEKSSPSPDNHQEDESSINMHSSQAKDAAREAELRRLEKNERLIDKYIEEQHLLLSSDQDSFPEDSNSSDCRYLSRSRSCSPDLRDHHLVVSKSGASGHLTPDRRPVPSPISGMKRDFPVSKKMRTESHLQTADSASSHPRSLLNNGEKAFFLDLCEESIKDSGRVTWDHVCHIFYKLMPNATHLTKKQLKNIYHNNKMKQRSANTTVADQPIIESSQKSSTDLVGSDSRSNTPADDVSDHNYCKDFSEAAGDSSTPAHPDDKVLMIRTPFTSFQSSPYTRVIISHEPKPQTSPNRRSVKRKSVSLSDGNVGTPKGKLIHDRTSPLTVITSQSTHHTTPNPSIQDASTSLNQNSLIDSDKFSQYRKLFDLEFKVLERLGNLSLYTSETPLSLEKAYRIFKQKEQKITNEFISGERKVLNGQEFINQPDDEFEAVVFSIHKRFDNLRQFFSSTNFHSSLSKSRVTGSGLPRVSVNLTFEGSTWLSRVKW